MIIKKFTAETMSDALALVRRELGEDAVILQSRQLEKSGLLSFLSRKVVEVTAATPDKRPAKTRPVSFNQEQREALARSAGAGSVASTPASTLAVSNDSSGNNSPATGGDASLSTLKGMQSDLSDLRESVRELATHVKYRNAPSLPEKLAQCWRNLVDNGVTERIAHDLMQQIHMEFGGPDLEDDRMIEDRLSSLIRSRINTGKVPVLSGRGKALSVALIGPTGVGKTTTLAKLATNRKIFGAKRVALISTDTYRIAAVEQLQTFASIAGLPMEVVYRPEELPKAIAAHHDKDIILIDTAGRSQNDSGALLDLREFIEAGAPDEVLLVLSTGTRIEDQRDMVKRFGQIPATRVILSKLDETASAGHLLDIAELLPRQWAYLTVGQNVPDDIILAEPGLLAGIVSSNAGFQRIRRRGFTMEKKPC